MVETAMSFAGGVRRRVLIVWLVLGALVVGIAAMEFRNRSRLAESVAEHVPGAEGSRVLIPAPIADLGAIELGLRQDGGIGRLAEHDALLRLYGKLAGNQSGVYFIHRFPDVCGGRRYRQLYDLELESTGRFLHQQHFG